MSRMTLAMCAQSPEFLPSMPDPRPATEMSVQGNPPDTTSTKLRHGTASNVRMSSHTGNAGMLPSSWRASNTRRAYSSISTAQTQRHPSMCPASMPPPAPAKSASSFTAPPSPVAGLASGDVGGQKGGQQKRRQGCPSIVTGTSRARTCSPGLASTRTANANPATNATPHQKRSTRGPT